ncbi:putative Retrovirus-related Pol polyprotein from transposon [Paratrimastix pyriformis]|uniref:Retrovirus-related Pol polyprotein from transposon n=1 Tax=Paratrimastix pyriformis TaxID=342808 RepID=A0ABQ8U7U1_9EUKA|nr:putative Retrovirus-related Pol polyprotein from transposon [Paratrimastix pyriformis]
MLSGDSATTSGFDPSAPSYLPPVPQQQAEMQPQQQPEKQPSSQDHSQPQPPLDPLSLLISTIASLPHQVGVPTPPKLQELTFDAVHDFLRKTDEYRFQYPRVTMPTFFQCASSKVQLYARSVLALDPTTTNDAFSRALLIHLRPKLMVQKTARLSQTQGLCTRPWPALGPALLAEFYPGSNITLEQAYGGAAQLAQAFTESSRLMQLASTPTPSLPGKTPTSPPPCLPAFPSCAPTQSPTSLLPSPFSRDSPPRPQHPPRQPQCLGSSVPLSTNNAKRRAGVRCRQKHSEDAAHCPRPLHHPPPNRATTSAPARHTPASARAAVIMPETTTPPFEASNPPVDVDPLVVPSDGNLTLREGALHLHIQHPCGPVDAVVDTGATASFVGHAYAKTLNLTPQPLTSPKRIRLADGKDTLVTHMTTITLQLTPDAPPTAIELLMWDSREPYLLLGTPALAGYNLDLSPRPATNPLPRASGVLTPEQRWVMAKLVFDNADLFGDIVPEAADLPAFSVELKPGTTPITQPPRRLPPDKAEFLRHALDALQEAQVIRPSESPWASPIVLAPKGHTFRLCADYTRLNQYVVRNAYPLPNIHELLAKFAGCPLLSHFDLSAGYHQIAVSPASVPVLAFTTPIGLFEYTKMPFGIATAAAHFEICMAQALSAEADISTYQDDISIHSTGFANFFATHTRFFAICNIADFLSRAFPTTPHLTTLPAAPEPTQPTLRCCAISTPTVTATNTPVTPPTPPEPPVHPTLPDDFVEANTLRPLLDQLPYDIDDNGIIRLHDTPPPDLLSPLFALAHSHPLAGHMGARRTTERLQQAITWPHISADITRLTAATTTAKQPLHPLATAALKEGEYLVEEVFGHDLRDGHLWFRVKWVDYPPESMSGWHRLPLGPGRQSLH